MGDAFVLEGLKTLFSGCEFKVFSNEETKEYPKLNFDEVNKCDLFILGGGELINRDRLFVYSPWVHNVTIPKIILGCGVNVEKPKQIKREVIRDLEQFSYIGLRDHVACNILSSVPSLKNKVDLFYDTAFAIDISNYKRAPLDYIAVFPTDRFNRKCDEGIREFKMGEKSGSWLWQQLAPYKNKVFVPLGSEDNNDYFTCEELISFHAPFWKIVVPKKTSDVLEVIAGANQVVAYRLHALILAFMFGAPYSFYPYHWKLQRVHDTISNISLCQIRIKQRAVVAEKIKSDLCWK